MDLDTAGYRLGDKVRDVITGAEGTIVAFTVWMGGSAQATIQPPATPTVPQTFSVDVARLERPNTKPLGFKGSGDR